jgi:uncharacterized protein (DUF58 family)
VATTVTLSASFRQFDRLSFIARRPARAGAGGEHVSRRPSPSTDFVDFRPYQPGDDFRRIDWNVYGRLGSLQVKVTEGRERLDVVLALDCSSSMGFGQPAKLDFGVQLVAALAYVGTGRADNVRLALMGATTERLGPFGRRSQVPDVVRQLSALMPTGAVELNSGITDCLPDGSSQGKILVVVSDLLAPDGAVAALDSLTARGVDAVVVHVVSPEELDPSLAGEVELIDSESGELLELGVSLNTLAAYREQFAAWLEERAADCRKRGIRYVRVRTDRPLNAVVLDDLRRAKVLR